MTSDELYCQTEAEGLGGLAHVSLSRFSQLSGHYDKTFKTTRGSRGMQLGIIGEDMPTREHKHSLGTGLSYMSEGAPATRMSIAQQLQEQVVSASLPGKSQHMRVCWMFGESIQNGRGMRRRAGIRVPNLPSSKISNPAIFHLTDVQKPGYYLGPVNFGS
jgi:hypothetical protein